MPAAAVASCPLLLRAAWPPSPGGRLRSLKKKVESRMLDLACSSMDMESGKPAMPPQADRTKQAQIPRAGVQVCRVSQGRNVCFREEPGSCTSSSAPWLTIEGHITPFCFRDDTLGVQVLQGLPLVDVEDHGGQADEPRLLLLLILPRLRHPPSTQPWGDLFWLYG